MEVHLYHPMENRFRPCFVAEPLAGGVSTAFQHGGMNLALLRITHHFVGNADDRRGAAIVDPTDIEERLSGIPIEKTRLQPARPSEPKPIPNHKIGQNPGMQA